MTPAEADRTAQQLAARFKNAPSMWSFARQNRRLPEPVIRALLTRLEAVPSPWSAFVRAYVGDAADLTEAWGRTTDRMRTLEASGAWGSKKKRDTLMALAQEPRLVEALQAALVAGEVASLDAFGVLALDASDASVDALLPHFERAARTGDSGLDRLQMLKKYATPTPAMTAMLARVDALLDHRKAASPALALATHLGLGRLKEFHFTVVLGTDDATLPIVQGHVHVDSRNADWMDVVLSVGQRRSHFTSRTQHDDALGLGRCTAEDLPAWLAAASARLKRTPVAVHTASNLRGKKRDRLVEWLTAGK